MTIEPSKGGHARPGQSRSEIGIVAIGRNEGPRLEQCLESLLKQSKRVVYADSASTDDSVALARRLGVEVVELPNDMPLSAAAGRAAGFALLRSLYPEVELVQFIDGDCVLDHKWLSIADGFLCTRPVAAAVCGRRYEAHPGASVYNASCDAEWDTAIGMAKACGGDALYRVGPYEAAGGFRTDLLAGEEPELCRRLRALGQEVWRIDAKMTEHDARMLSFGQWWRRSRRGGYAYAHVFDLTRGTRNPMYGRQLASAVIWMIVLPLGAIVLASLLRWPAALGVIPMAYAVQTMRIYRKVRADRPHRLAQAALTLLAKLPECSGAVRYLISGFRPSAGARS